MNNSDHHHSEKTFSDTTKYERFITKLGVIVFPVLMLGDVITRINSGENFLFYDILFVQIALYALFVVINLAKINTIKKEKAHFLKYYGIIKIAEVIIMPFLVSTLHLSADYYFLPLFLITFISLSRGFKRTVPYIMLSWLTQIFAQILIPYWLDELRQGGPFDNFILIFQSVSFHYILIALFCSVLGSVYNEYRRSEEENNILIDRLGDKYVQLEQVKKEIQAHYDKMRETNNQLEETNSKLTSSLAEFYTLQQISQAITSIFDMNELLKFVNDVIIGVMGVYHSTIALCYGPQNKLKVQVSSIFDKKDLAIVSDYINSDVLKPSTDEGHSMIDNSVTPEEYPFTQGRSIQSMICVPLLAKGKPLGIVLIEHNIKNAFDKDNVRLLEIISQQVSIAIENARLYQQMHDLATFDGLTGAYNRPYFQDKLEEEYKKAQEKGYDLSLIIFDIDHFKKFNDTYGHLFGDLVLKTICAHIMKTLRKEDIFARYGGEEFVVLMPHVSLEQAQEKAEDLRKSISQLTITDRVVAASVTMSVGVSTFPQTASKPTELIKTADDALYEAKNTGRNLVSIAKIREMQDKLI